MKNRIYDYNRWNKTILCNWNNNCLELINRSKTTKRGYGRITRDKQNHLTHRWIYYINYGYFPEVVMHKCDNAKCINSEHLQAGTFKLNSEDMVNKGRSCRGLKNGGGVKLNEEKVKEIKSMIKNKELSLRKIAIKYKVSRRLIGYIRDNKKWGWIE